MFMLRFHAIKNVLYQPSRSLPCKSKIITNFVRHKTVYFNYFVRKEEKIPNEAVKWILLAIPVTSFGLGCWQVQRREWKLNLLKFMNDKSSAPPTELPLDISELASMEYNPVKVRGTFLHDREILFGPRSLVEHGGLTPAAGSLITNPNKNQGFLVITPFVLSDKKKVILVNRGWVPSTMKNPNKRLPGQIEEEVEIVGLVRLTEKRPPFVPRNKPESGQWFYRDLDEICEITGSSPVWLDIKGSENMPNGWPIPNQTRISVRNEHMSYLITWFSLSGATFFMWFRQFIKKMPLL